MIDVNNARFELVELCGRNCMFSAQQIDTATIPETVHWYPVYTDSIGRTLGKSLAPNRRLNGILLSYGRIGFHGKSELPLYGDDGFQRTGIIFPFVAYNNLNLIDIPWRKATCLEKMMPAGNILVRMEEGEENAPQILEVVLEHVKDDRIVSKTLFRLEGETEDPALNGYVYDGIDLTDFPNMEI